jgi:glyceraldehyde-3-phosphate dehydrogenase/erythrose-4-phosphate dehydrogenase
MKALTISGPGRTVGPRRKCCGAAMVSKIVTINGLIQADNHLYLVCYDSVYGRYDAPVVRRRRIF